MKRQIFIVLFFGLCYCLNTPWGLLAQGMSGTGRGPELVFTERYAAKNIKLVGKLSLESEVQFQDFTFQGKLPNQFDVFGGIALGKN